MEIVDFQVFADLLATMPKIAKIYMDSRRTLGTPPPNPIVWRGLECPQDIMLDGCTEGLLSLLKGLLSIAARLEIVCVAPHRCSIFGCNTISPTPEAHGGHHRVPSAQLQRGWVYPSSGAASCSTCSVPPNQRSFSPANAGNARFSHNADDSMSEEKPL